MTTIIERFPSTFVGPNVASLPIVVEVDPLESKGSLYLLEPAHPLSPWSGVPANGSGVPNLLANVLPDASAFAVSNGDGWIGTAGRLERTTKGGLHGIISQGQSLSGTRFRLTSTTVTNYLLANLNHSYYVSKWYRVTRGYPGGSGVPPEVGSLAGNVQAAGNYLWRFNNLTVGQPLLEQKNPKAWTGTSVPSGSGSTLQAYILHGRDGGMNSYVDTAQKNPSIITYRDYVEDLTVSGRTYSEVAALDNAEFTRQVLTEGGRYYGDTFTNPTTIP